VSQSHLTLAFPLKSPADANVVAEKLPPIMSDLFEAADLRNGPLLSLYGPQRADAAFPRRLRRRIWPARAGTGAARGRYSTSSSSTWRTRRQRRSQAMPTRSSIGPQRQDAGFWIENASIKWDETQTPFHTVARLTLLPRSRLPEDTSEAIYFDVTGNSTPESAPLGSINRARWPAEVASREARAAGVRVHATEPARG
jgi:hypothetical protein